MPSANQREELSNWDLPETQGPHGNMCTMGLLGEAMENHCDGVQMTAWHNYKITNKMAASKLTNQTDWDRQSDDRWDKMDVDCRVTGQMK